MTREKLKQLLPYIGLPVLVAALPLLYAGKVDIFILLWCELIIVFGYIAAVFDVKAKTIPNKLVLIMLGAWVITMVPKLFLDIDTAIVLLKDAALGFATGGGLFLLVYLISRKGLGGGDVKFMAVAGMYIGFAGVLSSMLYGTILAAIIGLVLILLKKIGRKDSMPLAPFLYIGILLRVLFR